MSTTPQTPTAFDVPAGSEVFVIFARTAFDLGESVAVEWWPVGSTTDRAIAEAAVAGNRHARFETFPAHEQNLGTTPAGVAASGDASGECAGEELLSRLNAKVERGERLTNQERAQRQGVIFNHCGRASGFYVI